MLSVLVDRRWSDVVGSTAKMVAREVFDLCGLGIEGHVRVEGEQRPKGPLVSEVREVGAGGTGGVDVQETRAPVGIHMRLAMR